MFVEALDAESRSVIFSKFYAETEQALVEVFDKRDGDARALVRALYQRFADAPVGEQNLLLHNDPVALASTLAEVPWDHIDAARLDAFNRRRREALPNLP